MSEIRILVVEDSQEKLAGILRCLTSVHSVTLECITDCRDVIGAKQLLSLHRFDLLVVDIAIPNRRDSNIEKYGGVKVLEEISSRENYLVPSHVIGLTAYDALLPDAERAFLARDWLVLKYAESDEDWFTRLQEKASHIVLDLARRGNNLGYKSDLAVICALQDPELRSVRDLPWSWTRLVVPGDHNRYFRGAISSGARSLTVYAASAARMGMPSSAVLAAKMIELFRPRYLAMTGIAAGVRGKVNIGDAIVADPSWNYGSGKLRRSGDTSLFAPEPHQCHISAGMREGFRSLSEDYSMLAGIKEAWRGKKPETELKIHVGPIASGAAVLADSEKLQEVTEQHRKLLGVDMEAYAVFAAAEDARQPAPEAFCIKSVCDFADETKDDDYQAYAAFTSAQLLRQFVQVNFGSS